MKSLVVLSLVIVAAFALPFEWEEDAFSFEGIEKRIAGGEVAKPGQFPFQARLLVSRREWYGSLVKARCGGTLISDRFVLTAAHCISMAEHAVVTLGTLSADENDSNSIEIFVKGRSFFTHDWTHLTFVNDIGLIMLPEPVKFNAYIQPANLPKASEGDLLGRTGMISGFGLNGESPSKELRFAIRNVVDSIRCEAAYGYRFKPETHLCVDGSGGQSACRGDSGGPFAVADKVDGSATVVGITSYGSFSCTSGSPVVYTRVTAYLDWINKITDIPIRK